MTTDQRREKYVNDLLFPRRFPWFKTLLLILLMFLIGNYIWTTIESHFTQQMGCVENQTQHLDGPLR